MEAYLMEFIEAFTHLILYIMNIYSSEHFEKKRKFNTLVWHCANKQVEEYIQQALYPIKRFIANNSLYKYRISLKNLKNEVLKIYTIEFEQLYQPRKKQINYPAFEELVWDLFTYIEMQLCEAYATDKTFEISFDLVKDHEATSTTNENLTKDWELISCDTLNLFDKKIIKSINFFENNEFNPICQVYVEHRRDAAQTNVA
ncbi:Mitotic spindle assembly checkpoint protein [Plasmodium coatneyi]|uniref:Mitotic spindle assembly checkpoint protein n=1 Tax=Plasmodium coatneyi TaxID=208452 RepID=A0A1B1DWA7_9APIC|nr:Mitotic spindle assembly checkpoint protein [Plasmodium coatneyi]ANQ07048.1 Mitotic spindle assembly checkpoint protein [Plasmodium coatneyi]